MDKNIQDVLVVEVGQSLPVNNVWIVKNGSIVKKFITEDVKVAILNLKKLQLITEIEEF
jgi:hypothetical protein